jgi:hypothetical protein
VHPVRGRVQLVRSPVFVDATGRRRAWAIWGVGMTSTLCCVYVLVLGVGLAGGAVRPGELLPGASGRNDARYERATRVARVPAAARTAAPGRAPIAELIAEDIAEHIAAQQAEVAPTGIPAVAPSRRSPSTRGPQTPGPTATAEKRIVAAGSSTAPVSPTTSPTTSPTPTASPTTSPTTSPAATPSSSATVPTPTAPTSQAAAPSAPTSTGPASTAQTTVTPTTSATAVGSSSGTASGG